MWSGEISGSKSCGYRLFYTLFLCSTNPFSKEFDLSEKKAQTLEEKVTMSAYFIA